MAATNMMECSVLVEVETHSKCEKTERQLEDRREFLDKTHPDVGKYHSLSTCTITCQGEGNSCTLLTTSHPVLSRTALASRTLSVYGLHLPLNSLRVLSQDKAETA